MDSGSGNAQSIRFYPNGLLPNEVASVTGPLDRKRWTRAEENAAKLISCIQPNWASEKHRNAVASYVQCLIANCMPCLVVTFGSVPLKTYLPDGDIDLTAFSEDQNLKDKWADEVRNMLEKEEKNEGAEFQVKEVQYIQAEVKIIKCLVDNIVVDISFNQLGGLCTLCFLEEVDNMISQNHLFKRSIILIKAWCYYESRILGAHHGLISTYALETLVLYIFHVFNNSFAGPLEVLYRFLEFFSKFDWANYCVSLWGPVPTSSLPHLAAIPPRKDGGELLLNKMFLSTCSTAYSVFPGGLENQEQSFLSKHFNIIDPLRINNNLGRSVSKGNFYRIRSAFSLGAQKLARILECQEESIAEEVEQIFMNTWNRHSEGGRPDAPIINVIHLRQVDSVHGRNFKEQASNKKSTEKLVRPDPAVDQAHHSPKSAFNHGNFPLSPTIRNINAPNNYDVTTDQEASGWGHRYPWRTYLADEQQNEETCRIGILQTRGRLMPQFSRTCSSPELANISREAASCRHNVGTEKMEVDGISTSNNNGKTRGSSIMEYYVAEYSTDEPHKTENSSHFDIYTAFNPNFFLGSYVGKSVADSTKSVTSGVEQNQSHEEVQNFKNLVSSSAIQKYDGLVQGHVNLASHPLVPISPSVLQYSHPDFNGTIRAKLTSLESDCGTIRQYHDGPSPMPVQHTDAVRVRSDREEMIGKLNNRGVLAEVGHQGDRSSFWTDRDTDSIGEINPVSDKFSTSSSRLSPSSPATSSWTKASSESSWDKKPSNITNLVKSSLGNRTAGSWNPSSIANSGWQVDGDFADQAYDDLDDNCCDWTPLSTGEAVVTSSHAEVHQLPGFRPSQTSYPNSVLSFAPLLLHTGSQQGVTHNHAVLPVAFYPAGPPVPFITMMPVCNVYTETTTPGPSTYQVDLETEKEKSIFPVSQSGGSSDLAMDSELLSHSDNHNSVERSPSGEHSDKVVSDIFLSDFASHWKYLQYGRLCQSPQLQHPFFYPPSVIGAPQHLPEHLPFNAPGKPSPVSADALSHQVPVSAMQPGSGKPVGFTRQFGEVSMYRNGTGTYFPNPKIFRDRQFVTARQYHGDHYHDGNEHHEDKEANWKFNSKTRFTGHAEARHRYEKPNVKMDHSAHSPSQTGHWDTFQNKPNRLQRFSKGQSTSKPARKGFKNVDSSMYWMQSAHHNEVSPSGDSHPHMVCTSAETVSCGSPIEQLQFGSIGPDSFVGVDGVPDLHGGYPIGGNHDKKNYHGGDSG